VEETSPTTLQRLEIKIIGFQKYRFYVIMTSTIEGRFLIRKLP